MSMSINRTSDAQRSQLARDESNALHRVVEGSHERLDVFGPTIEYLTSPEEARNDFSVMRGVIPPGVAVPLHSHPDTEDFYVLSGEVEGLRQVAGGYEWISAQAGDYIHVPSGARHAWRNVSHEPLVALIITTARLGCILHEAGRPVTGEPQPPTPEEKARFAALSARYGHWLATPEENAAVGIHL